MKIELDTYSKDDVLRLIRMLFKEYLTEEEKTEMKQELYPEQKLTNTKDAISEEEPEEILPSTPIPEKTIVFSKDSLRDEYGYFKTMQELLLILLKKFDMSTVADLEKYTHGVFNQGTIASTLSTMKTKGQIESSVDKPKKYFLKGQNTELKELLKNAKRGVYYDN